MNTDVITALADPSVQGRLAPLGYESRPDAPEQVGAFLKADAELWDRVIKEAGIAPQDRSQFFPHVAAILIPDRNSQRRRHS